MLSYPSRLGPDDIPTPAAVVDELVLRLCEKCDCDLLVDDNNNLSLYIFRPYLNQAEGLLYRINTYERPPEFVIWKDDIPAGLARALKDLGIIMMRKVLTEVVRRIYESVDPDYFNTNGIYGRVKWRVAE